MSRKHVLRLRKTIVGDNKPFYDIKHRYLVDKKEWMPMWQNTLNRFTVQNWPTPSITDRYQRLLRGAMKDLGDFL